jgi:glutathione S-transferase
MAAGIKLIAMPISPWSEKARWALDHHQVAHRYVEHVPMLGEPLLRARAKQWKGRVSVPLLTDGDVRLNDSFAIAQHAEKIGSGTPLFAAGFEAETEAWNQTSERALSAGRSLVLPKIAESRGALAENLPPFVPGMLRSTLAPITASAVGFLTRKYAAQESLGDAYGVIAGACASLEEALGGRETLIEGGFTYADIAASVMLMVVRPPDVPEARHIRIGRATRECWTEPSLVKRFAGLLEWRDRIYARHRPRPIGA